MVLKLVSGNKGRPKLLEVFFKDGRIDIPDGLWHIVKGTPEEKKIISGDKRWSEMVKFNV
jgi:hypothetical protein